MTPLPYSPEIAARMNDGAETPIAPNALFYHTQNGYWIAWQPEIAAVLPPKGFSSNSENKSLAELVSLIESGDYEALLAADADEPAHNHGCACGCARN